MFCSLLGNCADGERKQAISLMAREQDEHFELPSCLLREPEQFGDIAVDNCQSAVFRTLD
jgi:hypothetical protein